MPCKWNVYPLYADKIIFLKKYKFYAQIGKKTIVGILNTH